MSSIIVDRSPVSTPAHESAQQTTSALDSNTNSNSQATYMDTDGATTGSSATTPGLEFPGSFPRELKSTEPKDALQPIVSDVPSLQTAREDVTRMIGNVGETVKSYLPASVASMLPAGTAPHANEKELGASLDPASTAKPASSKENLASDTNIAASNDNTGKLKKDDRLEQVDDASLSRSPPVISEEPTFQGHSSLEGTTAKLSTLGPEHDQVDAASDSQAAPLAEAAEPVAPTPPAKDESEVSTSSPPQEKHDQPLVTATPTQPHVLLSSGTNADIGNSSHESSKTGQGTGQSKLTESFSSTSDTHSQFSPATSASSVGTDGHKKPKLMDRVKGEMKVLSGKIGRNHDKVEEGKRMKGVNA